MPPSHGVYALSAGRWVVKVPFSVGLGLIAVDSLTFNAVLVAGVVAGAFAGR